MTFVIVGIGESAIQAPKGIVMVSVLDEAVKLLINRHGFIKSSYRITGVDPLLISPKGEQCTLVGVDTFA